MPEENRVFDVAKPGHSSPSATSKPIIVGHHPTMSDPMVNDTAAPSSYIETPPTKIDIKDENNEQDGHSFLVNKTENEKPLSAETDGGSPWITPPAFGTAAEPAPEPQISPEATEPVPEAGPSPAEMPDQTDGPMFSDREPDDSPEPSSEPPADEPIEPISHVEGLHVSEPKPNRRWGLVVLVVLVLIVGAYLAIDSGLIKTSLNLPFHIFKQKTAPTTAANTTTAPQQSQPAATTLPPSFSEYKLAGTTITFAAPTSWGQPSSSTDPGYSARGGTNKSDGTYAYLVDFANNKDVQIAVTSNKYLPPARGSQYYDALQWCTGTNDGKYYLGTLRFITSADKIDTPTTVTCDQGPLSDVTKIDSATIVQLKAKDSVGKVQGDIYVKNLSSTDLPVFRVKDTAMTNGTDIKQLLNTVKIPKDTSATSPAQ